MYPPITENGFQEAENLLSLEIDSQLKEIFDLMIPEDELEIIAPSIEDFFHLFLDKLKANS